jgi:hypothetical protein
MEWFLTAIVVYYVTLLLTLPTQVNKIITVTPLVAAKGSLIWIIFIVWAVILLL